MVLMTKYANKIEHESRPFNRAMRLETGANRESRNLPRGTMVEEDIPEKEETGNLLRHWCSPEYADQRQCLTWTHRIVLYLRCVEGYTLDAIGEVFGCSKENVRLIQNRAANTLAAYRKMRGW